MTIFFLNRFFYPDHSATSQMLSDLAFALAKQDRSVTIITSRLLYDEPGRSLPAYERSGRVNIHRVWTTRFGRSSLLGRASDYVTFYLSSSWMLFRLARRDDVVVTKTDPPLLSILTGPIIRLRKALAVNWLQDVFPEVAEVLTRPRPATRILFAGLTWLRDRSLHKADANVVIGQRMAEVLLRLGVRSERIHTIPNWADCEHLVPVDHDRNNFRSALGYTSEVVIGYSGNLGRAHDLDTLVGAISILDQREKNAEQPIVRWLFIGGGALLDEFRGLVTEKKWTSVNFQPYQPRDQLASSLSCADIHLVTLKPALEGYIVPSKFYGIVAAGRPAIFIGDEKGEIARLLAHHQCGITVKEGDAQGLAEAILQIASNSDLSSRMRNNARLAAETDFDKSIAVGRWVNLISSLRRS